MFRTFSTKPKFGESYQLQKIMLAVPWRLLSTGSHSNLLRRKRIKNPLDPVSGLTLIGSWWLLFGFWRLLLIFVCSWYEPLNNRSRLVHILSSGVHTTNFHGNWSVFTDVAYKQLMVAKNNFEKNKPIKGCFTLIAPFLDTSIGL